MSSDEVKFTIRIPKELNLRLKKHADEEDRSKNAQLVNILKNYFKEQDVFEKNVRNKKRETF